MALPDHYLYRIAHRCRSRRAGYSTGTWLMIHYTCDRCKRQINIDDQTRYVVQIDIQSAAEEPLMEADDDIDQLSELHQMLEGQIDPTIDSESSDSSHHGRYDLCPECHREFLKNPLGRDRALALGFSNN